MAWPTVAVTTTNMDATSDSPATARSDILDLTTKFNDAIAMRGVANGIASLGSDTRLPFAQKPAFRGAQVYCTSQSVLNVNLPSVIFDAENFDTDSIHDNATNNTRLTVPSGVSYVRISALIYFSVNNTGDRNIRVYKNGSFSYEVSQKGIQTAVMAQGVSIWPALYNVSSGDYFEIKVYQNSGITLNVANSLFEMEILA